MKHLIALLLLALTPMLASAASITLAWDPNDPEDNVTGYKVYWSQTSGQFTEVPNTFGNVTEHTVHNLSPGQTYYFVVTAYNSAGESDRSNEVSWTFSPLPGKPALLRIK